MDSMDLKPYKIRPLKPAMQEIVNRIATNYGDYVVHGNRNSGAYQPSFSNNPKLTGGFTGYVPNTQGQA